MSSAQPETTQPETIQPAIQPAIQPEPTQPTTTPTESDSNKPNATAAARKEQSFRQRRKEYKRLAPRVEKEKEEGASSSRTKHVHRPASRAQIGRITALAKQIYANEKFNPIDLLTSWINTHGRVPIRFSVGASVLSSETVEERDLENRMVDLLYKLTHPHFFTANKREFGWSGNSTEDDSLKGLEVALQQVLKARAE